MNMPNLADITRRHFLSGGGLGLGALALSTLIGQEARADVAINSMQPLAERKPQFAPRQSRHLPAPDRLAAKSGFVRLQAGTGQT